MVVEISTDYIKLGQFLKLAGLIGTGSDAKILLLNGEIRVNKLVETARGRKLYPGDVVFYQNIRYEVVKEDAD